MTITLYDKRVDTTLYGKKKKNVIKDFERRSFSWIIWVGPKWWTLSSNLLQQPQETNIVGLTEVSLSLMSFNE